MSIFRNDGSRRLAVWFVIAGGLLAGCGDSSSALPDGKRGATVDATSTTSDAATTTSDAATTTSDATMGTTDAVTMADARVDANYPTFQAITDVYAPINVGGVNGTATAVAVSPDGLQMIVVGPTSDLGNTRWTVELYTGAARDTVVEIDGGASESDSINETPLGVAFSPTGDSFVVVGYSQTENSNNQPVQSWLVKRYSGANYSTIEVIDSAAGALGSAEAMSVAYSSDGTSFVVGGSNVDVVNSADYKWWVRLYSGDDFSTITDIETELTDDYGTGTFAVGFAPDSSIIAAANSSDNNGGYWTVQRYSGSDFSTVQILDRSQSAGSDFGDSPATLTFSPDGSFFVVVGWANPQFGIVKEYSGDGYGDVTVLDASAGTYLFGVAISPDGNEVIAAGHDGSGTGVVREYSGSNFSTVTTLFDGITPGATGRSLFTSAAYDPLSASFVEVGGDGWLVQSDSDSQSSSATAIALTASSPIGVSADPTGVAFSPDGQTLVVVGDEQFPSTGVKQVIRIYTGPEFSTVSMLEESESQGRSNPIVAISPDSQTMVVASAGFDGSNYVWNVRRYTGAGFQDVTTIVDSGTSSTGTQDAAPIAIQFSPDGASFALVGEIDSSWVVKRYSGAGFATVDTLEVSATIAGGSIAYAQGVAFSPDGQSFVAVGYAADGNFNFQWTIRQYGGVDFSTITPIATGAVNPGAAQAVAYSPNGEQLVVGGYEEDAGPHDSDWVVRSYSGASLGTINVIEDSSDLAGYGPAVVQYTPDGATLVAAGNTDNGWVVREYTGAGLATATTLPPTVGANGATFSNGGGLAIAPRGDWFVNVGDEYTVSSGDDNWVVLSAQLP